MENYQKESLAKMIRNSIAVLKSRQSNFHHHLQIDCSESAFTVSDGNRFYTIMGIDDTVQSVPDFKCKRVVSTLDFSKLSKHLKKGSMVEMVEAEDGVDVVIEQANGAKTTVKLKEETYYQRCPEERKSLDFDFPPLGEGKENRIDFKDPKAAVVFFKNAYALMSDNDEYRDFTSHLHILTDKGEGWVDSATVKMMDGGYITELKLKGLRADGENSGLHLHWRECLPTIIKMAEISNPQSHVEFNWKRKQKHTNDTRDVVLVQVWSGDQVIYFRTLQKSDEDLCLPDYDHIKAGLEKVAGIQCNAGDLQSYLKDGASGKNTAFVFGQGHYDFHNPDDGTVSEIYADDIKIENESNIPASRLSVKNLRAMLNFVPSQEFISLRFMRDESTGAVRVAWLMTDTGAFEGLLVVKEDKEEFYKV